MTTRRPKSITPELQFMVICESVEHDVDGNISLRHVFDSAAAAGTPPVMIAFTVSMQFRNGTGEHKCWLKILNPRGIEHTTDELSFWLASKAAAHRLDARLQLVLGPDDFGKFKITAVLDGRDLLELPLALSLIQQRPKPDRR